MIIIDGVIILAEVITILEDLREDLHTNGIDLLSDIKDSANNVMVTCISHNNGHEHKPSCGILKSSISRNGKVHEAGTVFCFTCGYRADIATFVANCWGSVDRTFGKRYLLRKYNTMETAQRPDIFLDTERKPKGSAPYKHIDEHELDKYRYTSDYLYSRGFNDTTIGFYEFGLDIPHNAITIPIRDHLGKLVFIKRRYINPHGDSKYMNQKGIPKQHILYGFDKILQLITAINNGTCQNKKLEENYYKYGVFLTEGEFNTAYLMQNNFPATSMLGRLLFEDKTHRTLMQKELLLRYGINKFVIWTDNDEPGKEAIQIISKQLINYQVLVPDFNQFPKLNDPNNFTAEQLAQQKFISPWF